MVLPLNSVDANALAVTRFNQASSALSTVPAQPRQESSGASPGANDAFKVEISREAKDLQSRFSRENQESDQEHRREQRQLEAEYSREKQQIEADYNRNKQQLEQKSLNRLGQLPPPVV